MNVEEIINKTVDRTIAKLKMENLLTDDKRTAYEKTEGILRAYPKLKELKDYKAKLVVNQVEAALLSIESDQFYDIIPMYYFSDYTNDVIAEQYKTSEKTIRRNKSRLVNELKIILFADDFIAELL